MKERQILYTLRATPAYKVNATLPILSSLPGPEEGRKERETKM